MVFVNQDSPDTGNEIRMPQHLAGETVIKTDGIDNVFCPQCGIGQQPVRQCDGKGASRIKRLPRPFGKRMIIPFKAGPDGKRIRLAEMIIDPPRRICNRAFRRRDVKLSQSLACVVCRARYQR